MPDRQASPVPDDGTRKARFPGERVLRRIFVVALTLATVLYFSVALTALTLRYVVAPHLDAFRPRLTAYLERTLDVHLEIGRLNAHWSGSSPSFDAYDVTIRDAQGVVALSVPHIEAVVGWRSLLRLRPTLASLVIDQPRLMAARAADGTLSIAGVRFKPSNGRRYAFNDWLLTQGAIVIHNGTLQWQDALHSGPPLTFSGLRLAVLNRGYRHRIGLQVQSDPTLGGALDLRAQFRHAVLTEPGDPQHWSGQAYLSTVPLDLATLNNYLSAPIDIGGGQLGAQAWFSFQRGRIEAAHGSLDGNSLLVRAKPALPWVSAPSLSTQWSLRRKGDDYFAALRDVSFELANQGMLADGTPLIRQLTVGRFNAHYRPTTARLGALIGFDGDIADVGLLAEMALALPLPARIVQPLTALAPHGLLYDYSVGWEGNPRPDSLADKLAGMLPASAATATSNTYRYHLRARFQDLGVAAQVPSPGLNPAGHPHAGQPGFDNLSGTLDVDQAHGALTLDSHASAITIRGLFDAPRLPFDTLAGKFDWSVATALDGSRQIDARATGLTLANPDAAARIDASYQGPLGDPRAGGVIDLHAAFSRIAVNSVARYLPTSLEDKLRHYLGHALQAGDGSGSIIVRGPIAQLPFQRNPNAGIFYIDADFNHGRFDFTPFPAKRLINGQVESWPPLEALVGHFSQHNNTLTVGITAGHYQRVKLDGATVRIDTLSDLQDKLQIHGNASGPLDDMLDYFNRSPLPLWTAGLTTRMRADGNAGLALQLSIPRHPSAEPLQIGVLGALTLAGNTLTYANAPPVTQLGGKLAFTEHTLQLNQLAGRFLGGPVSASGGLNADGSLNVDVNGNLDAASVSQLARGDSLAPLAARLTGGTAYTANVHGKSHAVPDVTVKSDLAGLAIDLPAPLGKTAAATMPFSAAWLPLSAAPLPASPQPLTPLGMILRTPPDARIEVTAGPLRAVYLQHGGNTQAPIAGSIALGTAPLAPLPAHGVVANLALDTLDADRWQTVLAPLPGTSAPALGANGWLPGRVDLRLGQLTLLQRHWDDLTLNAQHQSNGWQADLRSRQIAGHIEWQPDNGSNAPGTAGLLKARLTQLLIPPPLSPATPNPALREPPRRFPEIDLSAERFMIDQRNFGKLRVIAHNTGATVPTWQLDEITLVSPAGNFNAKGEWRGGATASSARSTLQFKLETGDAGALLAQLGLPRTVRNGAGTFSGDIRWNGTPATIDYSSLAGTLALDLRRGQILKVDPGLAKLLGVLSLQSLGRFLTFDFSGLFGAGLPFDTVKASGTVADGIVRTQDFDLNGNAAHITMAGQADLKNETQDLKVNVIPVVGAGSAALAAAVVNPLLGLGTLVAQLVLSDPIARGLAREYRISGTWSAPHIERIDGNSR